jgi:hypothetical protein
MLARRPRRPPPQSERRRGGTLVVVLTADVEANRYVETERKTGNVVLAIA